MNNFDIIVTLFTIVYGLLLTDLFASLHRLLRVWKKVKWNLLSLLTAWYLFLLIIKNWWDLAIPDVGSYNYNVLYFVAYAHLLILLYLLVSAALPDKVRENGVDLKEYYFNNHRYFWSLMAGVGLFSLLISVFQQTSNSAVNIYNVIANLLFLLFTILLIIIKKIWFHYFVVTLFVLITILEIMQHI